MRHKRDFLLALKKEIALRADEFNQGKTLRSIYFGGGTPSILSPKEWEFIFALLMPYIQQTSTPIEITAEVNPEDMTKANINHWRQLGINRLSVGLQSFAADTLLWMNRGHNAAKALAAIAQAQAIGFDNINIDYILNTPSTDKKLLITDIQTLAKLHIQHISAYNLTVERKTALMHQVEEGKISMLPDDMVVKQFTTMHDACTTLGFEHYEISNYALKGYKSKHNAAYWEGQSYIGLGPSSHSFDQKKRYYNISNNLRYIKSLTEGTLPTTIETLTPANQYNEYIMLGIRSTQGIDIDVLAHNWGKKIAKRFLHQVKPFIQQKWILKQDHHFYASVDGWIFSDYMSSSLFVEDKDLL